MKLKSLTLNGFKSFADKTTITFQDGMTGIVGPNGSGKSNIIEALRWVLGEQSAKSLRGGKMPDVIFAGSQTRAPLNHAEVVLSFDNADRFLELQTDEVTITRRIYRNGDSDFLINNKNVRLRDIVDLFMDTGLGRESFSIISQGKVEAIFNSKPQDRRVLIEEVAGVVKYKKEKQKALQELAETTDHLDRVADIITELKQQREPLKQQASIARDYVKQKEEYDHYEKSRLVLEIKQNSEQKVALEQKIAEIDQLLAEQTKQVQLQEQKTQKLHDKQEKLETDFDAEQKEFNELTSQRERLIGRQDMSKHDYDLYRERLAEYAESIERDEASLKQFEQQKSELETAKSELVAQTDTYQKEFDDINKILVDDPETLAAQIEEMRQKIIDDMQAKVSLDNELTYLEQENERTTNQQEATLKRLEVAKQELEKFKAKQTESEQKVDDATAKQKQLKVQLASLQQELVTAQRLREDQQRRWLKASEILQRAKAQQESLQNVVAGLSGYYHGVKAILQADLPGVVGSVAQRLKVPQEVAKAIDVALGAQLQNVVVADEDTAKKAIRYLDQKRAGRATFLPRTTVKPRSLSVQQQNTLAQLAGVVGVAKDLVTYDAKDRPIVEHLLGAIIIAKDLEAATKIAVHLGYSVKIVTLNGEVLNAGGSMTGGRDKNQRTGLLEQQQQLTQISTNIAKMEEKLTQIEVEGGQTKKKIEDLQTKIEAQQELNQAALVKQQQANKTLELCMVETQHQAETVASLELGLKADETALFGEKKAKLTKKLQALKQVIEEQQKELALRQALQKDSSKTQREQQDTLNDLTQKISLNQERIESLQVRLNEINVQLSQTLARIEKAKQRVAATKENQAKNELLDTDIEAKRQDVETRYNELQASLTTKKQARKEVRQKVTETQQLLKRANDLRQASLDEKGDFVAKLSSCKTTLTHNLDELAQNYGITYEVASQTNQETDLEFVKNKVHLLKLGIDELGEVNLGAISEFERINTRYEFLTQQQADLLEAKEQLTLSMDEMDNEARTRFEQAFNDVAQAFAEIFPQVFEGGKATLSLTDPTDLLTTGIEIMAQPPGKKFQHLNLLSGGERSLTAIVLLFAILKVRPVPFVVLDEAEAALDDANVVRYSRYLHQFNTDTQFIVITHRKGTMMNADILYGVTMQESGVSKMVSVSLDELD